MTAAARNQFSARRFPAADGSTRQRANGHAAPRPSPLAVLELRSWARSYLWQAGEFSLHDAVDQLQAAAFASGLVAEIGQDQVQEVLAAAFANVCEAG